MNREATKLSHVPRFLIVNAIALVLFGSLVQFGCGTSTPKAYVPAPTRSEDGATTTAPTQEEAEVFAARVKSVVEEDGDSPSLAKLIDCDALAESFLTTSNLSREKKIQYTTATRLILVPQLSAAVVKAESKVSYSVLRIQTDGESTSVVFRAVRDGVGLDYHTYSLSKPKGWQTRATDIFVFGASSRISEAIQSSVMIAEDAQPVTNFQKVMGTQEDTLKAIKRLPATMSLYQDGKYAAFIEEYDRFPSVLQREKRLQIARISCALEIDQVLADKALLDFKSQFGEDSCIPFLQLEHYLANQKWTDAIQSYDEIDKIIDGDSYLDVCRARLFRFSGNLSKARESALRTIALGENLLDAYDVLAFIELERKDFASLNEVLFQMNQKCNARPTLEDHPLFEEYVESKEFKSVLTREYFLKR